MDSILGFFSEHKMAEIVIGLIGILGFTVIVERFKALYFDYSINTAEFMKTVMNLLMNNNVDQAITFCAANQHKPLAHVIKRILERSDRDGHSIEKSYDIASSEVAPKLVRNLAHLPMISNVVTLVGLFGTVIGLIIAFKAISFADPSQKQALLTQGISLAMTATAAGLAVAIPVMFLYSFLYTRQTRLFAEIDQNAQIVIEWLADRGHNINENMVYPDVRGNSSEKLKAPPSAPKRSA